MSHDDEFAVIFNKSARDAFQAKRPWECGSKNFILEAAHKNAVASAWQKSMQRRLMSLFTDSKKKQNKRRHPSLCIHPSIHRIGDCRLSLSLTKSWHHPERAAPSSPAEHRRWFNIHFPPEGSVLSPVAALPPTVVLTSPPSCWRAQGKTKPIPSAANLDGGSGCSVIYNT